MSAKFVSQKVCKIRWQPQSASLAANEVFVTGSADDRINNLTLWNVTPGSDEKFDFAKQATFQVDGDVTELQWLLNNVVCATTSDGSAILVHLDRNSNLSELKAWKGLHHIGSKNVSCTGFASLVNHLVTVGEDSRICVLQEDQSVPVREIVSADFCSISCVVAAGESSLLTGNSRGLMKIWDIRQNGDKAVESFMLTDQGELSATCIGRHPTQSHVVIVGHRDGSLSVWDLRKVESPQSIFDGHDSAVNELHFHDFAPNHIVTCSEGGDFWHWDVSAAAERHTGLPFHEHEVSPWLRVAGDSESFSVQELLPNIILGVNSLSVSGNRVLCGADDEAIYLVDGGSQLQYGQVSWQFESGELISLSELNLDGNDLQDIPSYLSFPNLRKLSLDHNNISEIENGVFRNVSNLEILSLNKNQLEHIHEDAFSGVSSLSVLYLQGNRLHSIPVAIKKITSLKELYLYHNQISRVPSGIFQGIIGLTYVELGHNPLRRVDQHAFSGLPYLRKLELRSNQLVEVPDLSHCLHLKVLDLSGNRITDLARLHFVNHSNLQDLLLHNNHIHFIGANTFMGLDKLKTLDLSHNRISYIDPEAFLPFRNSLVDLNLGDNFFDLMPTAGLDNVEHLKVQNNPRLHIFPGPESLPRVRSLVASYAYHCCQFMAEIEELSSSILDDMEDYNASFMGDLFDQFDLFRFNMSSYRVITEIIPDTSRNRRNIECAPRPGPFMPCYDLFEWWGLRCSVWLVFLTALLGNGVVVFVLVFARSKIDVPRFLVANLAAADFFMGLYLGILAFVDASTIGEFRYYAISWQFSGGCKLAGFFGVLSSELSVFTLAVITMERNYAITHAMHLNKRLSLRHASYIMAGGWSFAIIVALLPLVGISDYRKFAVCLPFEVGNGISLGYVIFLMATNGIAVSILLGCYLKMYCAIRGSHAWNSNDTRIAKRMALLVFTDFLCWAPIAFFSLTSAFGYHLLSLEEAKVLTVFILPVNSCINPFLYAILTKQFKKDCVLICKAIEESRVTRGIGRCRHSSNFSNQKTPANTNSTDRSRDGSSCHCSSRSDNMRDHTHRRPHQRLMHVFLRCYDVREVSDVSCSSQDYAYAAAELQKNKKKREHRRAESVSSDNFSSSRSDSVKQPGCVPLPFGRRRNSWTVTRKPSQDSNLSNSRNDSSTSGMTTSTSVGSNWRSRSSVSSDAGSTVRDKNSLKDKNKDKNNIKERNGEPEVIKYGRAPKPEFLKRPSARQLPTSPLAAGAVQTTITGKYAVQRTVSPKEGCSSSVLPKPKPKLTRQIAFHDESTNPKVVSFDVKTPVIREPCPVHQRLATTSESEEDDVFEAPAYLEGKGDTSDDDAEPTDKLLQYYTQSADRNRLRVSTFQPRKLSTISSRSVSLNPDVVEPTDEEDKNLQRKDHGKG